PISLVMALDMRVEWVEIWRAQTYRETPHPLKFLLLGYGAIGVMGWYSAGVLLYRKNLNVWALWLFLASLMSYLAPLPNKREFAFFVSMPLGVLAAPVAEGVCRWFLRVTSRRDLGVAACVVFLYLCVWQVPLIYAQTLISFRPQDTYNGYYLTGEYQEVFNLINEERGVILCPEWLGNLIPAYTDCRPYAGHLTETLHYSEKKRKLDAFFKGEMDFGEMKDFLAQNMIRWVIYDVHEKGYREDHLREILGSPLLEGKEVVVWRL
ncbi:MAG: hypothetical protein K6U74_06350, partial [Firmicutes bacterium]|nr:hypothetical protein [Bacillota bacterium]